MDAPKFDPVSGVATCCCGHQQHHGAWSIEDANAFKMPDGSLFDSFCRRCGRLHLVAKSDGDFSSAPYAHACASLQHLEEAERLREQFRAAYDGAFRSYTAMLGETLALIRSKIDIMKEVARSFTPGSADAEEYDWIIRAAEADDAVSEWFGGLFASPAGEQQSAGAIGAEQRRTETAPCGDIDEAG